MLASVKGGKNTSDWIKPIKKKKSICVLVYPSSTWVERGLQCGRGLHYVWSVCGVCVFFFPLSVSVCARLDHTAAVLSQARGRGRGVERAPLQEITKGVTWRAPVYTATPPLPFFFFCCCFFFGEMTSRDRHRKDKHVERPLKGCYYENNDDFLFYDDDSKT